MFIHDDWFWFWFVLFALYCVIQASLEHATTTWHAKIQNHNYAALAELEKRELISEHMCPAKLDWLCYVLTCSPSVVAIGRREMGHMCPEISSRLFLLHSKANESWKHEFICSSYLMNSCVPQDVCSSWLCNCVLLHKAHICFISCWLSTCNKIHSI
jgi:hypothetical protein